ncbi:MAG: exosortase/archaeosortase family protein [Kiritimatiellia bacterium]
MLSACAGLIFAQFHLFGNTTETYLFGTSAFNWMFMLWKSSGIFGGSIYYLGWIIPFASLWLIHLRRGDLARSNRKVFWPGLLLVILAIFLHWAGARAQQTRLSLLAFILLLWAIPLFLYGWSLARQLIFPIGLLVFCVPLNFLDVLTFPMRVLAAGAAELLASGLGVVVERAGSVIRLTDPAVSLNGADPASGLATLLTMIAVTMIAGARLRDPWWLRILLPVLVFPLMLFTGALRLLTGILLAKWTTPGIALSFHQQGGLLFMLLSTCALLVVIRLRMSRLLPS